MNQISKRAPSGNAVVVPSGNLGPRPDFAWVALDRLVVDERYQRRISSEGSLLINRIVVRALRIIAAAQPDADNAFRASTVTAVGRLVGTHGDSLDDSRLGGSVEAALQVILARSYNKGLRRDGCRLPEA